ncbi:MAG: hypothetical protein ACRDRZ_03625 [Pseudonocardiaceae bacterium]
MEIRVQGADQFAALARRLKQAGDKELRRELYRGINRAAKPVRADIKRSALATLPTRGGLAALVAGSRIRVQRRTGGASVGIRMVGTSAHDIAAMNRGVVRHPLHGNRGFWFAQAVPPGWWDRPTLATAPAARDEIVSVIEHVKRKIEG